MDVLVLVIALFAAAILFYMSGSGKSERVHPIAPSFNANPINPFYNQGFREHPYAQFARGPYEYPTFNEMRASYF